MDSIGFRDLLMLTLMGFVALVILMFPHINPPQEKDDEKRAVLTVYVHWPDDWDTDVDLWVRGPDDVAVGYSNQHGTYFDLVKDDLGHHDNDPSGQNFEEALARDVVDGEYVINLHLFANVEEVYPVPVEVVVMLKRERYQSATVVHKAEMNLNHVGEEVTVIRLTFQERRIVDRSELPVKIRTGSVY